MSSVLVQSQLLQFANDGKLLACADSHGVTLVGVTPSQGPIRIAQPAVAAIAVFPEEVWTLDEHRAQLRRFHRDGRVLGAPRALAMAPCTEWLVAPGAAPAVVMQGTRRQAIAVQRDELIEVPVPHGGIAIPRTARQQVICHEQVVRFGGGIQQRLLGNVIALGGAAVLEGNVLVLLVVDPRGQRGTIAFSTETGKVQRQFEVPSGETRIAAQRGLVVVHTSERRFAVIDIRSGRVRALVQAPVDVDDFAVDPAGERIAIRSSDAVRVYPLAVLSTSARPELELAIDRPPLPAAPVAPGGAGAAPASPSAPVPLRAPLASRGAGAAPPTSSGAGAAPSTEPLAELASQHQAARLPVAVGAQRSEVPMAIDAPQRPHGARGSTSLSPTPDRVRDAGAEAPRSVRAPEPSQAPSLEPSLEPSSMRDSAPAPVARGAFDPPAPGPSGSRAEGAAPSIIRPDDLPDTTPPETPPRWIEVVPPQGGVGARRSAPVEAPVVDILKLRGFGAPPKWPNVTRHEAARLLQGELRWIGLRAMLALARDWDTGRIAYANESRHPQELEAMSILGLQARHKAREHVVEAQSQLVDHERALVSDPSRRTEASPLAALAAEFRLSELATTILLVVAAPTIHGKLHRLYKILGSDPARADVDELLVEQILADTDEARSDIAHELSPGSALCRYGLIHAPAGARPHAPLAVDPVIVARLRAEPVDFGPGAATTVRSADRALHELLVPSGLLFEASRYLSRSPSDDHQVRICVRGPAGCGRRTVLAALAHKAGRDLGIVDLKRLPRPPDAFAAALRTELSRALLRGLVPCLVRLDDVTRGSDDPLHGVVQDVLGSHPGPAAVHLAPRAKVPLDPGYLLLDLEPPTETQRLGVWREALEQYGLAVDHPELIAARYRVGPGTIRSAVRAVAESRFQQGRFAGDVLTDLETRLRQSREVKLGDQARRVDRLADWSQLVLPDDTMRPLRELIGRARHRRTVFDDWGMERVAATARGLTALFEGSPGTGKTLVAGAIARELGLDLYQVDVSKVTSKWIGETEKNLGAIFDAAEDGQVILLFDEADSLFARRSEVRSSNDRFANLEVNYLLQRLDSFEGFAILTTNLGASIDPAFKRRLSFRLTFPFPDPEARVELWRVHLPATIPIAGMLDLYELANKYELSGGYIRNACVRAAFLAAEEGSHLTQAHLECAVQLEYAEVGKLSRSGRME